MRKSIRIRPKKLALALPKEDKVRLAIECSPEERKYIKMHAAHAEKTINEFVLECVHLRINRCSKSHIPNKETADTLNKSIKGEGLIHYNSVEDFLKSLRE